MLVSIKIVIPIDMLIFGEHGRNQNAIENKNTIKYPFRIGINKSETPRCECRMLSKIKTPSNTHTIYKQKRNPLL